MNNWRKNILGNKAIYVLLIFAMLIAQSIKLHMHVEHENTSLSGTEIHAVDIHALSYLNEASHEYTHHQGLQQHQDLQHHHEHDAVDVGSAANNLLKKIQMLNPFVFFVLTLLIILSVPQFRHIRSWYEEKTPRAFSYCLPPQRAPPIL